MHAWKYPFPGICSGDNSEYWSGNLYKLFALASFPSSGYYSHTRSMVALHRVAHSQSPCRRNRRRCVGGILHRNELHLPSSAAASAGCSSSSFPSIASSAACSSSFRRIPQIPFPKISASNIDDHHQRLRRQHKKSPIRTPYILSWADFHVNGVINCSQIFGLWSLAQNPFPWVTPTWILGDKNVGRLVRCRSFHARYFVGISICIKQPSNRQRSAEQSTRILVLANRGLQSFHGSATRSSSSTNKQQCGRRYRLYSHQNRYGKGYPLRAP